MVIRMLWGNRVVVPPPGHAKVLDTLHEGHSGMERKKTLARCYVWWPSMEQEFKQKVEGYALCQVTQNSPPTHPWEWPQQPWARLHIDVLSWVRYVLDHCGYPFQVARRLCSEYT